ncbi:hypothetical protein V1511DRAFT_505302 [Dipodascopsis uninucleata]
MPDATVYATNIGLSGFLKGVGNFLGQVIIARKRNILIDINYSLITVFAFWAVIQTPMLMTWNIYLDRIFPTNTKTNSRPSKSNEKKNDRKARANIEQASLALNLSNVILKVLLTESIYSTFSNSLFLIYMTLMQTGSFEGAGRRIEKDLVNIQVASLKIWPLVTLVSVLILPADKRVLARAIVGIFWTIYLSLVSSK